MSSETKAWHSIYSKHQKTHIELLKYGNESISCENGCEKE
jgi:hypothetical protein